MKKIIIGVIFVIIVLGGIVVLYPTMSQGTQADCVADFDRQAADLVKQDYLENRLPRWNEEVSKLGTSTPELSFDNVRTDAGAYSVKFKATGPNSTIERVGMVDCKNHSIEYSVIN
ncbi:TPA: YebF family protein [Raoultella planticola]